MVYFDRHTRVSSTEQIWSTRCQSGISSSQIGNSSAHFVCSVKQNMAGYTVGCGLSYALAVCSRLGGCRSMQTVHRIKKTTQPGSCTTSRSQRTIGGDVDKVSNHSGMSQGNGKEINPSKSARMGR